MATVKWSLDPMHSEVQFKVKHLMITTITGYFQRFDVEVETEEEDFSHATKILFTADVNSINTNNEQRDTHLKSADFFNVNSHGDIKFVGNHYEQNGSNFAHLHGELTIKGITKPISVDVVFGGSVIDPFGQTKAGFSVNGIISRQEFDLTWNAATEAGVVVVSDNIKLKAEIQLVKQT